MPKSYKKIGIIAGVILLPVVVAFYYVHWGYFSTMPAAPVQCANCHAVQDAVVSHASGVHQDVACISCHGYPTKLDFDYYYDNYRIDTSPKIIEAMVERCADCHRKKHADWKSGPHAATYDRIYLDEKHNKTEQPMDDCLRCHGMFYPDAVRDLMTPLDTQGPWKLLDTEVGNHATVPCMACHNLHAPTDPELVGVPSTLGFYDRSSKLHVKAKHLPKPQLLHKGEAVKVSANLRDRVCYQCHASNPLHIVGSGDDRTSIDVHEGTGCVACHNPHNTRSEDTCNTCHPQMSNCNLPVREMNTTARDSLATHNIHFLKCTTCHTDGVPEAD
jgi:hypothetical protein